MAVDGDTFVRSCTYCLSTSVVGTVPRPYVLAVHGSSPNSLQQFVYNKIGLSLPGKTYVLIPQDEHFS